MLLIQLQAQAVVSRVTITSTSAEPGAGAAVRVAGAAVPGRVSATAAGAAQGPHRGQRPELGPKGTKGTAVDGKQRQPGSGHDDRGMKAGAGGCRGSKGQHKRWLPGHLSEAIGWAHQRRKASRSEDDAAH
jgi:hypothetical protein